MTFSLAGRCGRTGQFGVVVTSSSPAVAARCAYVRAGVGAACSQNITDPRLGPLLLDALAGGADAELAVAEVVAGAEDSRFRQLTAIGATGDGAAFSGDHTLGVHATARGADCVAAGNLLSDPKVPAAMISAFGDSPELPLAERLLSALESGLAAGGEAGPVRSAGLLVSGEVPWPIVDLRVDWHDRPVAELRALWDVYAPQVDDYVTRALNPTSAPGFGVPGDE